MGMAISTQNYKKGIETGSSMLFYKALDIANGLHQTLKQGLVYS